ncbi:hypothetical protein [Methanoplanus limicola]|uniref:hypothetical protein n=1 Tax=Methanoplanus limicola TaxID=2315 RepID=UPI0012F684D3|nr:hypothetical protein [Methanoplanus limicola]
MSAYEETFSEEGIELGQYSGTGTGTQHKGYGYVFNQLYLPDTQDKYGGTYFWTYEGTGLGINAEDDNGNSPIYISDENVGTLYWQIYRNAGGSVTNYRLWAYFTKDLASGSNTITLTGIYFDVPYFKYTGYNTSSNSEVGRIFLASGGYVAEGNYQSVRNMAWENTLTISESYPYQISLNRDGYFSTYSRYTNDIITVTDISDNDINDVVSTNDFSIVITSLAGNNYTYTNDNEAAPSNEVSIITRVKSLSDNSLIAGSKAYYRALDGSDLVNQTLPSGTGEFLLQKGLRYEYWAEASGYENQTSIPDQAAFYADSSNEIRLTPTYGDEPGEGMGVYNFYISEQTNAAGDTAPLTSPAAVTLNWQTKLTTSSGYVSFQVNKSAQVSYTIRKDGYVTVSRIYTPSWTGDTINEYIAIRPEGQVLPGDPTAAPTPDHRTSEAKAESALNIIFDNIEAIATLSVVVVILAMCDWMTPKRRR